MNKFTATPLHDIPSVVKSLQTTFKLGKTRDIAFRKNQLKQFWKLIDENEVELQQCLFQDLGKPVIEAQVMELMSIKNEIVHTLTNMDTWLASECAPDIPLEYKNFSPTIHKQPLGACLVIGAWNYPFVLVAAPFLAVIAAGNTGIMKPSELAPATAMALANLVPRYLDQSCYRVINGGEPVVTALLKEKFGHICYTGGANVGRIVLHAAAQHLTPVTLELGGKSPVIVTKSADIMVAATRIVYGRFACAGQTCVAPDYAMVEECVKDEFLNALQQVIRRFYQGKPQAEGKMGRMVNLRHWERVTDLLKRTRGNIIAGGHGDEKTLFIEPTVVSNVSLDDALMSDEIFGPILPVISFSSLEEACDLVSQILEDPLGLYLMTEDSNEVEYVLRNTRSGGVAINDTMTQIAVPNLPFGGVGRSGIGAYRGQAGFDSCSHRKSVVSVPSGAEDSLQWRYPTGVDAEKLAWIQNTLEAKP
ncbi:Aldehyde dehydrogenase,dimeric NADP-preferring [Lachnellula hyalina]|uniref:Aldehyde dehydrogenase n=1 Tax=Lachnellula hyalina TaxID=1316788 RepID=A0A8H8TUL9_9HELO|nr:Aldehyde dehydrogenase,dimeric NADP-preferring [Lachnellula hyalina]TVY22422.1 Aldehyde dehydrogenase,dimeric NADP-preferring [Lachnellula hyalina]